MLVFIPSLADGQANTLQCADITFSSNATALTGSACANSSNVAVSVVAQQVNGSVTTTSTAANATTSKSAAASFSDRSGSMTFVGTLAAAGAIGMSFLMGL
jgi:hypothetical protein